MPTRGRPEFAKRAVEMFRSQSYPCAELVIVDDQSNPSFPGVAEGFVEDRVRLQTNRSVSSLGCKRNLAASLAVGEVIMHWDDDDIYHPDRIADQVRRLIADNALVTGYSSMEFLASDGSRWHYEGSPDYALGVSLCYRREFWQKNPFPDLNTGEDLAFVLAARRSGRFLCVPSNGMIIATIHAGNTSPRQTNLSKQWRKLAA